MSPERAIIEFVSELKCQNLPENVVNAVKRMTLNTIAAMIAGSSANTIGKLSQLVRGWKGSEESTIFLHSVKVPMVEAAFVNSAMARVMDFDDFHMATGMHASATAIPVALAVADACPVVSGASYIAAVAASCEVMCRMRSVPDQCIGTSGWTGEIYGSFGAALAAGKLLSFNTDTFSSALGLAYAQSAGNSQAIFDGSEATAFQQGFCARSGLLSALMARSGLAGAHNFLTGKAGLYPVYYRGMTYSTDRILNALGRHYLLLGIATKPYPACGFTMAPIENAINLMKDYCLTVDKIEQVNIKVNKKMFATVCSPIESKYQPQTPADALFSMPYAVATAMLNGDVRLEDFNYTVLNLSSRIDLMRKIQISVDEKIEADATEKNLPLGTHSMEILCKDGRRYARKLNSATGFPDKPMSLENCATKAEKVLAFAARPVTPEKICSLKDKVINLELLDDVGVLFKELSN